MNEDIFSRLILQNFNQSLVNGDSPHCLKKSGVIPRRYTTFQRRCDVTLTLKRRRMSTEFLSLTKRKNLTNPVIDLCVFTSTEAATGSVL